MLNQMQAETRKMMSVKVAIVEDVATVREGLANLIDASKYLRCVGRFSDSETAADRVPKVLPDVLLVDIGLPGKSGIELTREMKSQFPSMQIVMLTVYDDEDRIFDSLKAGATGYLLKSVESSRLVDAILDVYHGGSPISPTIARRVVELFQSPRPLSDTVLTKREREILEPLCRGFTYREVGERLFISIDTVRSHVRHIYEKLHVRSKYELMMKSGMTGAEGSRKRKE